VVGGKKKPDRPEEPIRQTKPRKKEGSG